MDFFKKIDDSIKKISKSQGKNIYTLIAFLLIGIIFVLSVNIFSSFKEIDESENVDKENSITFNDIKKDSFEKAIEERLTKILSSLKGIGEIQVMVTLESKNQKNLAYNKRETEKLTKEEDGNSGIRTIDERNLDKQIVILRSQGGEDMPLVVKEFFPKIKGVIVVAQGANSANLQKQLIDAVSVVLDLPIHRIKVLPME